MTVSLKHSFTSAKADDADTTLVRPSNWNAEHTLTLATAKLLGRATAATGAAEEVGVGASLVLDAATTSLKRAALTGDVTATEDSNATSIANGAATLAKLDRTGTTGQLLTAQGVGSAPIWSSPSAATGTLLRAPQIKTSGTSYTTPSGCTSIYVEQVGGGGGGGGSSVGGGGWVGGGGGGSGAYAATYFTVTASTAYTYAIGAAGTAGAASGGTSGGTGGSTTFAVGATTVTAAGGVGGSGSGNAITSVNFTQGGLGGVATSGDMNIRGNPGITGTATSTAVCGGAGGGSYVGGAARTAPVNGTGTSAGVAGLTGSGGSGGSASSSSGAATIAGGAGGAGLIRIWEYA